MPRKKKLAAVLVVMGGPLDEFLKDVEDAVRGDAPADEPPPEPEPEKGSTDE